MTAPFRRPAPKPYRGLLPEAVDLAVIGGGVIGISTALYAARAGMRVVVLEKGHVAGEQSSRNWGWIRVQGRDPAEIPIVLEAQELWKALDAEAKGAMGVRQVGVTYMAKSSDEMAQFADWLTQARPFNVSSQLLDRAGMDKLLGDPRGSWLGALHTPTYLKDLPCGAVPELAK